jgi:ribosomal protein S18 acetylase RimI-like enzyme
MSDIRCDDWREAPADQVAQLFEAERHRWVDALHWDTAASLRSLEDARASGQAAGLIAHDASGRVAGWTCYLLQNRRLQIGSLVADSGEVTRRLLDGVLNSPEAEMAGEVLCFAFPASASLEGALARRRFEVRKYFYLRRTLSPSARFAAPGDGIDSRARLPQADQLRAWTENDGVDTVRLMARAYAGVPGARSFAPRGTLEEWATYLAQLIKTPACGRFLPDASLVVQHPADDRLRGMVLTTALQRDTAHVAQIAIDPAYRRRGYARALMQGAIERATAAGYWRLTLLVAEENDSARALYESLGFEAHGHFLYATRSAPNRLRGQKQATPRTLVAA